MNSVNDNVMSQCPKVGHSCEHIFSPALRPVNLEYLEMKPVN